MPVAGRLACHVVDLACFAVVVGGPLPLAALSAASSVVSRPAGLAGWSHATLVAGILWALCECAVCLATGTLGYFTRGGLLAAHAALCTAGIAAALRAHRRFGEARRTLRTDGDSLNGQLIAGLIGASLAFLLWVSKRALLDYDTLAYHLPPVARWVQTASLLRFGELPYHYPFSWEAVAGGFALSFGEDFLLSFGNWFAWSLYGVATYRVARDFGARWDSALVASVLVLGAPAVMAQVPSVHVDLALAAFFMAALHFALVPGWLGRSLFLAATALAATVKTSGLVYDALLVPVALVAGRPRTRDAVAPPRHFDLTAATLAAMSIAVGAFWYAGWAARGDNPLGNVELRIAGVTLLHGPMTRDDVARTTLLHAFHPFDPTTWRIAGRAVWGEFGSSFVVLSTIIALGATSLRPPVSTRGWRRLGVLSFVTIATLAAYVVTPSSGTNTAHAWRLTRWMGQALRYALPFLGMMGVCASVAMDRLPRLRPTLLAISVLVAIAATWNVGAPVGAVIGALAWYTARTVASSLATPSLRRAVWCTTAAAGVAIVVGVSWTARQHHAADRAKQYEGVQEALAANLSEGEPVGHALGWQMFVLYGPDLRRRVVEAPSADGDDPAAWAAALRRAGIGLVAVGPTGLLFHDRPEVAWARNPPAPFERVHGRDAERDIVLLRLRNGRMEP